MYVRCIYTCLRVCGDRTTRVGIPLMYDFISPTHISIILLHVRIDVIDIRTICLGLCMYAYIQGI